jgi:2-phospho-L-lactate/phosphoenolpyruvate guanylyltransferase
MRAILLPIKDLTNAKQRLAGVLTPNQRFELAQAMLADTIRAVRGVNQAEKIFVVTNYAPVMRLADENGWEVLLEDRQISESHSVDVASRACMARGITRLLRLPLDIPLVQSRDIDALLEIECPRNAVVLVPSQDGTGTNAILRCPPTLFPSHFGHGSFAEHRAEAERRGAQITVRRNARLELDVDDGDDLSLLVRHDLRGTATGQWLRESGVGTRYLADLESRRLAASS